MFAVIQIVQRSPRLLTTSSLVCGSLGAPLAIKIAQNSPRLITFSGSDPGGAWYNLAEQTTQGHLGY